MADPENPPGPGDLGRRSPDAGQLALGFAAAANLIHRLHDHLHELDTADLPVVSGRTVRIVALSEVEEWLLGLETRARNGVLL